MTSKQLAALAERKKVWRAKPSVFVADVFGVKPRPAQVEALDALRPDNSRGRVTVHGYRGSGKTALLAWYTICFAITHKDAIVVLLSGSWMQLREILFPEITYWIDVAARRGISLGAPPKRTSWEPFGGRRAVGVSPREPGRIQGFHARQNGAIATVCDEPASVRDEIYAATRGYDANARICQRLSAGIPGWLWTDTANVGRPSSPRSYPQSRRDRLPPCRTTEDAEPAAARSLPGRAGPMRWATEWLACRETRGSALDWHGRLCCAFPAAAAARPQYRRRPADLLASDPAQPRMVPPPR